MIGRAHGAYSPEQPSKYDAKLMGVCKCFVLLASSLVQSAKPADAVRFGAPAHPQNAHL